MTCKKIHTEYNSYCQTHVPGKTVVYLFLQHAAQICPTWMTSCMQFEKLEGYSFGTDILEGGWIGVVCVRELKKERDCVYT